MDKLYEILPGFLKSPVAVISYMIAIIVFLILTIVLIIVLCKKSSTAKSLRNNNSSLKENVAELEDENAKLNLTNRDLNAALKEEKNKCIRLRDEKAKELKDATYDAVISKAKELKVKLPQYPSLQEISKAINVKETSLKNLEKARKKAKNKK